jgi:alpha-L-fucosidase
LPKNVVDTFATVVAINIKGEIKSAISNPIPSYHQSVTASSTMEDGQDKWNAKNVTDNNPKTSWRSTTTDSTAWLDIDLGTATSIGALALTEAGGRSQQFVIEYHDGAEWKKIVEGKNIGNAYFTQFAPVKASHFRVHILKSKPGGIELREFQLFFDE